MSDEDPFAEDDDTEKTVIVPNPGGRRPGVAAVAPPATARPTEPDPQPQAPGAEAAMSAAMTGTNPLNAAAAPLFALVSRIRNRAQHADPDNLRRAVVAEVRAFEGKALSAGCDPQAIKVARYALCATLDDVVLNTPWGGTSAWSQQSMVATFHRETVGGDRFYDLLARLEQDPARNLETLEFLYMCLSLGFEGRLRVEKGGADKHLEIRAGLARLIGTQRGAPPEDLSPHWQGVIKPHRVRSAWKPIWIAIAAVTALLSSGFLGLSYALSGATERVNGQLSVLEPGTAPTLLRQSPKLVAVTPPADDAQLTRVSGFLTKEIEAGLVSVFQSGNTLTVRINGNGMFASASDALTPAFKQPLAQVAAALNDTTGPVIIAGHSDSQPIRTARFKSNMDLSLARAQSVQGVLAAQISAPDRLSAEGRADAEPIGSNKTAEGRAANRRIEIILVRENAQ